MKTLNFLSWLTVILNGCIVIGAGHGIGILFIYEILGFKFILDEDINFFGSYDERLVPVALISLICQVLLLISLWAKPWKTKKMLITVFCLILVLAFLFLVRDFPESGIDTFSLIGGIPFFISAVILLIRVNFVIKE